MAALWDLITVDGMDALAVKQACKFAKEHVLKNGPIVLIWHIRLRRMDPHHHHHLYPRTGQVRETLALHIPYRILHENLQSKITSFFFFSRAASTFRGLLASGKCSSWGMKYLKTLTRSANQKDLSDISLIENCYL